MSASNCLNCGQTIHSKFCPDCGQRTDTHRIVMKHFVLHDMLHGVWHLERGILFTIKEAVIRPGQAAMDYISGKRIRYYNVFYLCLLMIGFNLLLSHYYFPEEEPVKRDEKSAKFIAFFSHNIKFIILGIVPILALYARLMFRRLKLNIAEHFIIAGMALLGMSLFSAVFMTVIFIDYWLPDFMQYVELTIFFCIFFYPVWVYRNAVKGHYRFLGLIWRFFVFYLLILITMIIALAIIIRLVTGGRSITI